MEETLDVNWFKANEKHIDLILTIAPNVPTFLLLDYTRIQQIIMNLVSNALKFTKTGEIELKVDFNISLLLNEFKIISEMNST